MKTLEPKLIWQIFDKITKVPRASKKEGKITEWLIAFANEHNLDYQKDAIGNIVIRQEATPGMESAPTVILQSHMDMVCEKNSDTTFDFDHDPIQTYIEDGWVKAHGTTLGADCGIGMAASLAVLIDPSLKHGAIEALFTVDEETGLTGAFNLDGTMLHGKYLLNLDSEDDGELFIGCAGGIDTIATFPYTRERLPSGYDTYRCDIKGLTGGHSGDDINRGYANSNKLMTRFLWEATRKFNIRLAEFNGGNLRNAIPREAFATFAAHKDAACDVIELFKRIGSEIMDEFHCTEHNIHLSVNLCQGIENVIDKQSQINLLNSLYAVPCGVLAMSRSMVGMVETSTNLASVKFVGDAIEVVTSQRSSSESSKHDAANAVESAFVLGGATVRHSDGYPGWNPNPESHVLDVLRTAYSDLFQEEAAVKSIHAGLECGLFLEKYPHLEMVSFGPTIKGVHSPDERLLINTVDKFWKLLALTLERV